MADPDRLEMALKRLNAALDQLDAAGHRLDRAGTERRDLEDSLAAMQDDRAQLAQDLDAALVRTRTLEHATDEVADQLGRAALSLRRLFVSLSAGEA